MHILSPFYSIFIPNLNIFPCQTTRRWGRILGSWVKILSTACLSNHLLESRHVLQIGCSYWTWKSFLFLLLASFICGRTHIIVRKENLSCLLKGIVHISNFWQTKKDTKENDLCEGFTDFVHVIINNNDCAETLIIWQTFVIMKRNPLHEKVWQAFY